MSDRFIDWLFDTLILVDVQHQELLRGFGVLLLIPFALFLLSYGLHATGVISTDFEKKITADTPLGRLGQLEDIAKVAVFLASDESRWITGERVVVSGGLRSVVPFHDGMRKKI